MIYSANAEAKTSKGSGIRSNTLFFLLLSLAVLVVFSGRSFPSQDGPLHLYYADVTRNLILGTGFYESGYQIRFFLTPYITQTYLLLAFQTFFESILAEKILVSLYVVTFCLGFRYIVRSLAPENTSLSICALIFVFNYPIYKGFYNFCLGMVIALWITGFWIRHSRNLTMPRSCVFAGLMILAALSHPIPLFFCLMFLMIHTGVQILWEPTGSVQQPIHTNRRAIVHVALSASTLIWIFQFTDRGDFQAGAVAVAERFREFFLMYIVFPLRVRFWRWSAILVITAAAVATGRWFWSQRKDLRRRVQAGQISLVLMSVACLTIALIAPARISGGTLIAPRFALFGFVVLVAAGACMPLKQPVKRAATALTIPVVLGIFLMLADVNQRVLASGSSIFEATPSASNGSVAWLPANATGSEGELNWTPRRHLGAHYARRSKAVLLGFDLLDAPYTNLSPRLQHTCMYGITKDCLLANAGEPKRRPALDVLVSDMDVPEIARLYGLDHRVSSDAVKIFLRRRPTPAGNLAP